jgi:hypothetical protein
MPKGAGIKQPLLDALLGGYTGISKPVTFYVALFNDVPTENGGTEVGNVAGYQRVAVANDATKWVFTSPNLMKNLSTITFPAVLTPGWGLLQGFGLFDVPTIGSGFLYYAGSISAPFTPNINDVVVFAPSALVVSED